MVKFRTADLSNFVATSECRTMIDAAKKLGITQPALSQSIQRLESDLQKTLFYRSRTGIQLTPNGKQILIKASKVLEAFSKLSGEENQTSLFAGKTIAIGCHSTVAQYVLPKAFAYLLKWAPDYKVRLQHELSRNIQLEVQRGNIDIGIVINPVEVPDLVIRKMAKDVVSVWSSKKPFDQERVICNPSLFQTQHILRKWKNRPVKMIETESIELICQLTAAGLGYGIIPRRAVEILGLKINEEPSLPTFIDQISIVFRPEFGGDQAEALVIKAFRSTLS